MNRKKALGRGISAMIPQGDQSSESPRNTAEIPLDQIRANPNQPRKDFDEEGMMELVASISEHGVIQPVTLRMTGENHYEIIAGERRFRACKYLNYTHIPAYIREVPEDMDIMEMALIENIQRENLNAVEEAEAYSVLIERYGLSQDSVAKRVGKKRSTVTNSLRLLRLPDALRASLINPADGFTAGHARAVLALEDEKRMLNLWNRILSEKLSVRQTEELVSRLTAPKSASSGAVKENTGKKAKSPYVRNIEDRLQTLLGTRVQLKISERKEGGQIGIEFYSREDLSRILELFDSIEI